MCLQHALVKILSICYSWRPEWYMGYDDRLRKLCQSLWWGSAVPCIPDGIADGVSSSRLQQQG